MSSGRTESEDRGQCTACRGTGRVSSGQGGTPHEITCPWCGGDGRFHPDRDAQEYAPALEGAPGGEPGGRREG